MLSSQQQATGRPQSQRYNEKILYPPVRGDTRNSRAMMTMMIGWKEYLHWFIISYIFCLVNFSIIFKLNALWFWTKYTQYHFYTKMSVSLNAAKSAKSRRLTPFPLPVDKFGSKRKKGGANSLTSLLCGTYKLICSYKWFLHETQCAWLRQVYIDKGETWDIWIGLNMFKNY